MFQKFYPDLYVDSTYHIRFEQLWADGYRGLIFDIDNTLVTHGAPANEKAKALFARLKEIGFSCCLLSNNDEPRVAMFNDDVQVFYVYDAHKPSVSGYMAAMEKMGTDKETTMFIGDQIFTDIYGAKRTGLTAIMVRYIYWKEEIQIILKRRLEAIVLLFYRAHIRRQDHTDPHSFYALKNRYYNEMGE